MRFVWDDSAKRYGTLDDGKNQIKYDGDKDFVDVKDISKISDANMVAGWMKDGFGGGSLTEVMWNTAARAAVNALYDKKGAFDQTVKDFAISEAVYTLFAEDWLAPYISILQNVPVKVADPRAFFRQQDLEAAINHALGLTLTENAWKMLIQRKGFSLSVPKLLRNIVSLTVANIIQRRNQVAGADYRQK